MSEIDCRPEELAFLLSPEAVRARSRAIYDLACEGKTGFRIHHERIDDVADYVLQVTLENYPDLEIPGHSRWGHFQSGGVDRMKELDTSLSHLSMDERARAKLDLVIVSVLLDAGVGSAWKYVENETGLELSRSEGLAVASFRMFLDGAFSSSRLRPLCADAPGLAGISQTRLAQGFQVTSFNPIAGLEGRLSLLRQLGSAVQEDQVHFPAAEGQPARPGNLFDFCLRSSRGGKLPARELLLAILRGFSRIWPARIRVGSTPMGDVWHHPLLGEKGSVDSLVPFHKLSQWLAYSLIEPLESYGLKITGTEELTALAEYRNGGLLMDRGLIELRDPSQALEGHEAASPLIVEWRALTIDLLEKVAERVRIKMGKSEIELPLAKVLEGGTWHAGRKSATTLRGDGAPPLRVLSDGTVF